MVRWLFFNHQEVGGRPYDIVCLIWLHVVVNIFLICYYYLNLSLGTMCDNILKSFVGWFVLNTSIDARLAER